MNEYVQILLIFANWFGLLQWARLFMLLMEVVICKDAISVNTSRILNTSFIARVRLFRRSFKDLFYRATILLFIGSLFAVMFMVTELYSNMLPIKKYLWAAFSVLFPVGVYMVYKSMGFRWTLHDNIAEFIKT